MATKDETAQSMADNFFHLDQGTRRIYRVLDADEANEGSALKLLEVNDVTPECGIMPIGLPAAPERGFEYHSIVIEITPAEFERLQRGELTLPHNWKLGDELFRTEEIGPFRECSSA